jgi:nucleotide-binding universal stress UspA family protein
MAAAKELLLVRRTARILFDLLFHSGDGDDRHALASALRDVARVDPAAVPGDIARRLLEDNEEEVKATARELVELLRDHAGKEFSTQVVHFGL